MLPGWMLLGRFCFCGSVDWQQGAELFVLVGGEVIDAGGDGGAPALLD